MTTKKYDCETMFDAPEPYGIMVESKDGSYVSAEAYDALKEATLALFVASSIGVRNSTAEVNAKAVLAELLGIEVIGTPIPKIPKFETGDTVTVEIQFKEFGGDEISADNLYGNPSYDDSFQFKVKHSDVIYTGNLGWEQGRGNNYRFYVGSDGSETWFAPSEVTHVEVK